MLGRIDVELAILVAEHAIREYRAVENEKHEAMRIYQEHCLYRGS